MIGIRERPVLELGDTEARVRLAASPATPPDLLRRLADDPEVLVRATVAMNRAAQPELDRTLTIDPDERVRALLARRLAALLPGLANGEQQAAQTHVRQSLSVLARDAAERVRAGLADVVKSMPEAPRDLVLALAQDGAPPVSDPVIRLSPLLTDADLLALLATPARAASVAARPGLSAVVADAVAEHADSGAVRMLLANNSAAIREATLDALVGKAAEHSDWHDPLVRRPALSARAQMALFGILADELLTVLSSRSDLSDELRRQLARRTADELAPDAARAPRGDDTLLANIRRLDAAGGLDEPALLEAARKGDHRSVAVMLAVASGLPLAAVDRAAELRSAKALVSLSWKAGFTMRAASMAQGLLGQLGPGTMLLPAAGGAFPLTPDEMAWQIEVLSEAGR